MEANTNVAQIIFLDLNMPIMDGWQFLEEFMTPNTQQIIIYIVTSSIDPVDEDKAKQYFLISNYVVKPITPESLKQWFNDIENEEDS